MIKYSEKRELVKECLKNRKDHPTAATIYSELKPKIKDLSLATVYRNLNMLVENGMLKRLTFDDEDHFDPMLKDHHHFVCKSCNKIFDIEDEKKLDLIEKKLVDKNIGEVVDVDLTIYGYCKDCVNKSNKK